MKIIKKALIFLGLLVTGLMLTALIIGKSYHFEKSIIINAPAEKVYEHISSTKAFNEWNPWLDIDPHIKIEYSGEQGKVGDQYCWDSKEDNAGAGCHKILELVPNQRQKTQMTFKRPFENVSTSQIVLIPEGNATKVVWDMDTELDYPMNLMKLMMDSGMEKSYGKGLQKLKELSEK